MADFKLSSGLKAILEHADVSLDLNSCNIQSQLHDGILLNKGTQKIIVDKNSKVYSFILFARSLTIAWINNPENWKWTTVKDSSGNSFEVAELLRIFYLDVSGKIEASKLLPGIEYKVAFEMLIKKEASKELPLNLELKVPNQPPQEHKLSLLPFPREEWGKIFVGTFTLSETDVHGSGDIEFRLFEHDNYQPKTHLLFKLAIIEPNPLS